ncbi:MAG: glycoside hydrolase [Infirmifilum sp.]
MESGRSFERKRVIVALLTVIILTSPYLFSPHVGLPRASAQPTIDGVGYDWPYSSCHALDFAGDLLSKNGFYDDSRDLIAWYYYSDANYAYMRIDLLDLAYGAEVASSGSISDALNIYILIGWSGAPGYQGWAPDYIQINGYGIYLPDYQWVLAVAIYDTSHYRVYDYNWNIVAQNTGLQVAFNSQWDIVELAVPASILTKYGWSSTTRVWAKVVTTYVEGGVSKAADVMPNTLTFSNGAYQWSGALFSDQYVGTAKLAIVQHGNQHLTDNRALNNPSSKNSYGYILYLHDDVSNRTGRNIPVNIHLSGTLLSSYLWWDPNFISYIKSLLARGRVDILGGVWAEHITAYFYDNFNAPSASYTKQQIQTVFGYTPLVAWVPERTWDHDRTGIAWTLSKYYKAVILDANTHHDDWMPSSNPLKPHKYDTTKTNGNTLYVFFIDWNTQQEFLANTDGGLNRDLRIKYIGLATSSDQQQVAVYADDWEKAAGIAGWDSNGPTYYENSLRWIAMHPWIQVVKLSSVVSWLDSGSWTPVTGFHAGYDTYLLLKQWVQAYPYDYRRAYDGWYWGTSVEESFAMLGSGQEKYPLPETIMPLGDVFGYTSWQGSPNNTVIYRLLAPGNLFDKAPKNELWQAALVTASSMLYETAWHDGDLNAGWGRQVWNHLRLANILLNAAYWLNDARAGKITGVSYKVGDFDWDGKNEVIVYTPSIFAYIDGVGGALAFLAFYNKTSNKVFIAVGAPMVYWTTENTMWYGASHLGMFVDDYYTATGKNYYNREYQIYSISLSSTSLTVTLSAPDLDADGKPDFSKSFIFGTSSNYVSVKYTGSKTGTLYVVTGFSVDPMASLQTGNPLRQVGTPSSTSYFGYYNSYSKAKAYVTPGTGASWTGSQDVVKYTLQYRAKLSFSLSTTSTSSATLYLYIKS